MVVSSPINTTIITTVSQTTSYYTTQTVVPTSTTTANVNILGLICNTLPCVGTFYGTTTTTGSTVYPVTRTTTSTIYTTTTTTGATLATAGVLGLASPWGYQGRINGSSFAISIVEQCARICGAMVPPSNYLGVQSNYQTANSDCYCANQLTPMAGLPGTQPYTDQLLVTNCEYCPDGKGNCGNVGAYAIITIPKNYLYTFSQTNSQQTITKSKTHINPNSIS